MGIGNKKVPPLKGGVGDMSGANEKLGATPSFVDDVVIYPATPFDSLVRSLWMFVPKDGNPV